MKSVKDRQLYKLVRSQTNNLFGVRHLLMREELHNLPIAAKQW